MTTRTDPSSRISRRAFGALGTGTALFGASSALSGALSGCGAGGDTGGERVVLTARATLESLSFTNSYGWQVELSRVLISIGPLRYVEGAPVARNGRSARALAALQRLLGVREAVAHPGHYAAGGTIGEMLTPACADLARGDLDLGSGPGVTGTAQSARFSFQAPPEGPMADALAPYVVRIEGSATSGDQTRVFRADADAAEVADTAGAPVVTGCPFSAGSVGADGLVTLTVRPGLWLDQVDFALVPASEDGAPAPLDPAATPHKAFVRGLKKAAAYRFDYVAATPVRLEMET